MNARRERETVLVKWKPEHRSLIAGYIDALMNILTIDQNGQVSTTEIFKLDILLKILTENITLKGIPTSRTKRALIRRAAFLRLKKYKVQDVHTFRRALAAEVRRHLSRPVEKYWILLPLHVPSEELGNSRSISILGNRLLFRTWNYVQRRFDLQSFLREANIFLRGRDITEMKLFTIFSPILVLSEGKDSREAFDTANRSFDLLRWLMNLTHQFGTITWQYGGYPRPLGMVLPPPACTVFNEDRSYHELLYTIVKYEEYQRNTLRGDEISEVRRLASRLGGPDSDAQTSAILIDALEKYGEALDAFEWRLAFLSLWQILELITLQSSANLNMKTVKSRVWNLLNQDPLMKDLLNALYETRNSLVHRGLFPDEEGLREVNLLKHVVERAINALSLLTRTCPTRASLERYYELTSKNDAELADRRRLIRSICQRRATN
ncbi:MAG: hypothetical protein H8E40_02680 [Chloroflexi bacterium]|nr:hypothetical protein [Chloroflexota bacterium]